MFRNKYLLVLIFLVFSLGTYSQENTIPGQLIVQLEPEISPEDFDRSSIPFDDWKFVDCLSKHVNIWLIEYEQEEIFPTNILRSFTRHHQISVAQFNHQVNLREVPNDPLFEEQWQHVNDNDADMDSDLAWETTTGGTTANGDEIVVCVIEGANLNHPDLIDNAWVNQGEIPNNGVDDDNNGYVDDYLGWNVETEDDSGVLTGSHGTRVSGCVGATGNNDLGVVGVNWDVKIMSVAGEEASDEASVLEAYDYALTMRMLYNETDGEQGAFVVATNASWGIDTGDPLSVPLWCAFYDTLGTHGILSCGATTNNTSLNIDEVGDIPTACSSNYLLSVTATNQNDERTTGGYGPIGVDLAAPGAGVYGLSNTSYGSMNGTSFASPHVAGAIALLYSAPCPSFMDLVQSNPGGAALLIKQSIMNGVDPVAELEGITVTGGRLNLNNSLQELLGLCSTENCLAPFGITAVSLEDDDYQVTWESLTSDNFDLRYKAVGEEEWNLIENIDINTYVIEDLPWCADYELQVMAHCEGGTSSGWSPSHFFETDGCCVAPETDSIEIINIDSTTVQIVWENILPATGYEVGITHEGEVDFIFITATENSITIDNLSPCTSYQAIIAPDCDELSISESVLFNTGGCGACVGNDYCLPPNTPNSNAEWIQSVTINEYENQSGNNNGYGDFTNDSFTLLPDSVYEITLSPGFPGIGYTEYFRVWIDLDQDGIFEDETEVVFESTAPSEEEASGTFTIPADAAHGSTRMRITMKWSNDDNTDFGPCDVFQYGEIEDYCIFLDTDNRIGSIEKEAPSIYPNPFSQSLTILHPYSEGSLELYDQFGRRIMAETLQSGENLISTGQLAAGMYFYHVNIPGGIQFSGKLIKE